MPGVLLTETHFTHKETEAQEGQVSYAESQQVRNRTRISTTPIDTRACAMDPLTALLDSSQALPDASYLPSFLSCGCVAYYDKTTPLPQKK